MGAKIEIGFSPVFPEFFVQKSYRRNGQGFAFRIIGGKFVGENMLGPVEFVGAGNKAEAPAHFLEKHIREMERLYRRGGQVREPWLPVTALILFVKERADVASLVFCAKQEG